jgi:hypothetical protein
MARKKPWAWLFRQFAGHVECCHSKSGRFDSRSEPEGFTIEEMALTVSDINAK